MKFSFEELQELNKVKPIVIVNGIEGELQWDECTLDISERWVSPHDPGDENDYEWRHPQTFLAMNGGRYFIEHILSINWNPRDHTFTDDEK